MNIFNIIETNEGVLLNMEYSERNFYDGSNGIRTWKEQWILLEQVPQKYEILESQPIINRRYELIDTSLASENIPLVIKKEDAVNDDYEWRDKYKMYASLYRSAHDEQPDIMVEHEFEFGARQKVDIVRKHDDISYKIQKTEWSNDGTVTLNNSYIKHQLIDVLLFPDIVLPDRPCMLTSEDTYKIIREYVKSNIDGRYAEITSDYNFCFTVKKKVPLAEKESYTVDINNSIFSKRKRKPKIETRYRAHRLIEIFEMTHKGDMYTGYTPIDGIRADNQSELNEKINTYLENLIEYINAPLVDCPQCRGAGVLIETAAQLPKP